MQLLSGGNTIGLIAVKSSSSSWQIAEKKYSVASYRKHAGYLVRQLRILRLVLTVRITQGMLMLMESDKPKPYS